MMITMDRIMERGSLIDVGMFLQSLMVAARARGLDTCPQAAFLEFHRIIAEVVGIPDNEMLVCGMSLGWADPAARINTLVTEREPVEGFASFQGF
jgi:nitroreductase